MALPKTVFVYEFEDNDEKFLTAVRIVTEIPDDQDGVLVGLYTLTEKGKLVVTKEVKLEESTATIKSSRLGRPPKLKKAN